MDAELERIESDRIGSNQIWINIKSKQNGKTWWPTTATQTIIFLRDCFGESRRGLLPEELFNRVSWAWMDFH